MNRILSFAIVILLSGIFITSCKKPSTVDSAAAVEAVGTAAQEPVGSAAAAGC